MALPEARRPVHTPGPSVICCHATYFCSGCRLAPCPTCSPSRGGHGHLSSSAFAPGAPLGQGQNCPGSHWGLRKADPSRSLLLSAECRARKRPSCLPYPPVDTTGTGSGEEEGLSRPDLCIPHPRRASLTIERTLDLSEMLLLSPSLPLGHKHCWVCWHRSPQ